VPDLVMEMSCKTTNRRVKQLALLGNVVVCFMCRQCVIVCGRLINFGGNGLEMACGAVSVHQRFSGAILPQKPKTPFNKSA
jgi:hypothetical protein